MSLRYSASLKKFPNLEGLTPEGDRDKLSQETDNLAMKIKANFPQVRILCTKSSCGAVVIKVPDKKTAKEIAKVCDCYVEKLKKKKK